MYQSVLATQYFFRLILHFKIIYSLIATLFLFQIASSMHTHMNQKHTEPTYSLSDTVKCDIADICKSSQHVTVTCSEDTNKTFEWKELSISRKFYRNHEVKHDNWTFKKNTDCLIVGIKKPIYQKFTNSTYGCWMKDSSSYKTGFSDETIWTTNESLPTLLYEYFNKTMYRHDLYARKYDLEFPFMGSSHVVFNGSFYYHQKGTPNIVCYDLLSHTSTSVSVPYFDLGNNSRLYCEQHHFMDFSVDDNGLWVIYGLAHSNNTVVLKLQEKSLNIEFGWNISVAHRRVGEMFIACGLLYVVYSTIERSTQIRFALDLFTNEQFGVNMPFTNAFKRTTMITYNHKFKELYTWDRGNHLIYPVQYKEFKHETEGEKNGKE